MASLLHFVFGNFENAVMNNEACVLLVCSCLNCISGFRDVVYVPTKHCTCALKMYKALSLIDAIREKAKKYKCRK